MNNSIRLRGLKDKDAPYMLEWMHDGEGVRYLKGNFLDKTIEDCEKFIKQSQYIDDNLHFAVADENDMYLGTVSLKNIDLLQKRAEFAISMRRMAMGKGISRIAMQMILNKGFDEMGLETIYWYVSKRNERAICFYDKNNYQRNNKILKNNAEEYIWYVASKNEFVMGKMD